MIIHYTPEEPDQPDCDADVDPAAPPVMWGTLNPAKVTCPDGRAPMDDDLMRELDAAEAVMAADDCEHHWVSHHEPGHIVYWVKICSICHTADWDDLDDEIRAAVAGLLLVPTAASCENRRENR